MEWCEFKKMWNRAYWYFAGVWALVGAALGALIYGIYWIYKKFSCDAIDNELK